MNPIEQFLALLRTWRDRGTVAYDVDEVAAPHAVVNSFDLGAFGRVADGLAAQSSVLSVALGRLDAVEAAIPHAWLGSGGDAVSAAAGQTGESLRPVVDELAEQARVAAAAHEILGEVLDDYRSAMARTAEPLAAGLSDSEAGEELGSRLDLAAAAGTAASRAVTESLDVLTERWRSDGELVLAGDR